MTDLIYLFVVLFGMFAHYMKKRVKGELLSGGVKEYLADSFWKTTFPAIAAGVLFMYGAIQSAHEWFYPINKMAVLWLFMSGYTSDSLLNGETSSTVIAGAKAEEKVTNG